MSQLLQWLAEAQADATETKLQHERMARALGGIASFSCSCDGCRYIVGIAKRALTGVESYEPLPLDPDTGALK
jgi:hypothetical protein